MPTPFQLRLKQTVKSGVLDKPSLVNVDGVDIPTKKATQSPTIEPQEVEATPIGFMSIPLLVDPNPESKPDQDFDETKELVMPEGLSDPTVAQDVGIPMSGLDQKMYPSFFHKVVDEVDPDDGEDGYDGDDASDLLKAIENEDDDEDDDEDFGNPQLHRDFGEDGLDHLETDDDDLVTPEIESELKFFDLLSAFLSVNPSPSDEQFHALAASVGVGPEDFEARVYRLMSMMMENEEISEDTRELLTARFNL